MRKTPKHMTKGVERNTRQLLRQLGVGSFNATMCIPYMWIAPSTTDPRSSQIILIVSHLQQKLVQLGFTVEPTGYIDTKTRQVLDKIVGPRWITSPWAETVAAVLAVPTEAVTVPDITVVPEGPQESLPDAVSGYFDFLPDVPGGLLLYGVGAFFLYRYLWKRKGA
jgi:hypothetical protein